MFESFVLFNSNCVAYSIMIVLSLSDIVDVHVVGPCVNGGMMSVNCWNCLGLESMREVPNLKFLAWYFETNTIFLS